MDLRETVLVLERPFLLGVKGVADTTIVRRIRLGVGGITRVEGLVDKQGVV
jgi:hypothetical protein